jgi:hypothetical protein
MLHIPLESLDEAALLQLCNDRVEESSRLEFKAQLNLVTRDEKREVAKDVSAMANSGGGRLVYGVGEHELPNGAHAAASIEPLTDAVAVASLENIICDAIAPRPRYRIQKVLVTRGFVLVVETYPSLGLDLHMVVGFDESRFYRRGEQRTMRMTESEVRAAYSRIAASRTDLEAAIERSVVAEKSKRGGAEESILVVPWYSRPGLIDPRRFTDLGAQLAGLRPMAGLRSLLLGLRLTGDGFRAALRTDVPELDAAIYLAIKRDGVVHFSNTHAIDRQTYLPMVLIRDLWRALTISRYVLDRAGYWGPVRIIHVLRVDREGRTLVRGPRDFRPPRLPPGELEQVVGEVNLQQVGDDFDPVVREVLDQLFHHAGVDRCPFFDATGHLLPEIRGELPSHFET